MLRAELLVTETKRDVTTPRLFGGFRVQAAVGAALGGRMHSADAQLETRPAPFEREPILRADGWHFVLLSLRRG